MRATRATTKKTQTSESLKNLLYCHFLLVVLFHWTEWLAAILFFLFILLEIVELFHFSKDQFSFCCISVKYIMYMYRDLKVFRAFARIIYIERSESKTTKKLTADDRITFNLYICEYWIYSYPFLFDVVSLQRLINCCFWWKYLPYKDTHSINRYILQIISKFYMISFRCAIEHSNESINIRCAHL